ncbi:hypothetical protein OIU77_016711 [Salix suchowensis]|uniref:Uncharacterized protein n=1 Tax=Salix suchowensis TaxID=1278906 RepID=A0ABQ8ZLV3_9ROSI|nr:hypothetical protein OIU77_016711 [Salix suchowensis]
MLETESNIRITKNKIAGTVTSTSGKKLIHNVSAQTLHSNGVLLGRDLDKDIDAFKDRFNFEVFKDFVLEYNTSGLIFVGLVSYAGQQNLDGQHDLAGELFRGSLAQAINIMAMGELFILIKRLYLLPSHEIYSSFLMHL